MENFHLVSVKFKKNTPDFFVFLLFENNEFYSIIWTHLTKVLHFVFI